MQDATVKLKSVPTLINRAKAHLYGMMEALGIEGKRREDIPVKIGQPPLYITPEELQRLKDARKR